MSWFAWVDMAVGVVALVFGSVSLRTGRALNVRVEFALVREQWWPLPCPGRCCPRRSSDSGSSSACVSLWRPAPPSARREASPPDVSGARQGVALSASLSSTSGSAPRGRSRGAGPDPEKVVIDLSAAHIWDASSVAALDAIETKYAQRGETVEITGLNDPSAHLHGKLSGELAASH